MSEPKHLLAFHGRPQDFEWTVVEPKPALAKPVPITPKPTKTEFYCRDADGNLVEASLFFERYAEGRLADPAWLAVQQRKYEGKQARKREREAAYSTLKPT